MSTGRLCALLMLLATVGCTSARMPVTNTFSSGRQPGEALVVMSLQVKPGSPLDNRGLQSIAVLFQPYDKATQRLHRELDLVTLFRLNGMIEFGQGGDLHAPLHTVYSLPPGEYIAVVSNLKFRSAWRTIYRAWFVPFEKDALAGDHPVAEAAVGEYQTIRFTVLPGTVTYVGDFAFTDFAPHPDSNLVRPLYELGRDDTAALAAVHRADPTVEALHWLPARLSDAVP